MISYLTSAAGGYAVAFIVVAGLMTAIYLLGRRAGRNSNVADSAAQEAATQAAIIARQKAEAQAEANAPKDVQDVIDQLNKGTV